MMHKRTTTLMSIFLCVAVLLAVPAYAAEMRASEQIKYSGATLLKKSTGDLEVFFTVTGTGRSIVIGAKSVEIQRSSNGTTWTTETTYTVDDMPELQSSDTSMYSHTFTYSPVYKSWSYRAIVKRI